MSADIVTKVIVISIIVLSLGAMGFGLSQILSDDDNVVKDQEELESGLLPDAFFRDQYGDVVEIHDFEGKYVVVDLTGVNCPFCPDQYAELREIDNKYSTSQVQIISIELWNEKNDWETTMNDMMNYSISGEINWLIGVDEFDDFIYRWDGSVPRIFILNPDGRIIFQPDAGIISAEEMLEYLP